MERKEGFGLWLTGLPAAGKTTLAEGLAKVLRDRGYAVQVLDSDALRRVLTPEPTYSAEERDWFHRVVAFIAGLLTENGTNVVIAATAHRRRYREYGRENISRFVEIYVRCSLAVCIERDEKGIYEKAMAGEATTVPGLQVGYEPPENPAVVVDTELLSPKLGVERILEQLEQISILRAG